MRNITFKQIHTKTRTVKQTPNICLSTMEVENFQLASTFVIVPVGVAITLGSHPHVYESSAFPLLNILKKDSR
jgi:hypothetical protein